MRIAVQSDPFDLGAEAASFARGVAGMGAVVTRDVESYTIVAGNLARVVSRRFSKDVADALEASAWWDMNDADLRASAELFTEPEAFLKSRGLL